MVKVLSQSDHDPKEYAMIQALQDNHPFLTNLSPNISEPFNVLFSPSLSTPYPFRKEDIPNLLQIARYSALKKTWASTHVISVLKEFADDLTEEQVVFLCPLLKDDPEHEEIIDKMPEIELISSCGDKAVKPLQIMLQYCELSDDEKNVVLETMGEIETPLARETLLTVATEMYRDNTPEVNGFLVSALVHSGVKEEGVPIIRKMFHEKLVDEFHMGAFDDVLIEMGLPLDRNDSEVRICKHCNEPYALCQRTIRENRRKESKLAEESAMTAFEKGDYDEALHLALKAKSLYITFDDDIIVTSLSNLGRYDEALGVLRNSSIRLFVDYDEKKKQKYKDREQEILNMFYNQGSQTLELLSKLNITKSDKPSTDECSHNSLSEEIRKQSRTAHYRHIRKQLSSSPPNAFILAQVEVVTGRWKVHRHDPLLPSCTFDERGFIYNNSCYSLCYHNLNKPKMDSNEIIEGVHELIASIAMRGEYIATGGGADYSVVISKRTNSDPSSVQRLKGHTDRVDYIHITSNQKKVISTSQSCGEIRVWDIETGKEDTIIYTGAFTSQLTTYENEIYVTLQKFPYIQIFDMTTGRWIASFLGHSNRCDTGDSNGCRAIAANLNYLLSGSNKFELYIWSRQTRCLLHKFNLKSACALRFALTENYAVAGLQGGRILLFCLSTGACVGQFRDHREDICGVHIQETNSYLAIYSAGVDGYIFRRKFPSLPFDASLQKIPVRKCMCCKKEEKGERFKRCSACKLVLYCSKECQLKDWKIHRQFCKEHS